jgi:hypothetical protein
MEIREAVVLKEKTALEELGVSEKFDIGLVLGGTMVRTLELWGSPDTEGKYYAVVLEKEILDKDQGLVTAVSINLVRKPNEGEFDVFAHVDGRLVGDRSTGSATAEGSYSNFGIYKEDLNEVSVKSALFGKEKKALISAVLARKEEKLDVAVRVEEYYKGLGVGEDLWVVSMAILEALGVGSRIIKVDATRGQKAGAEYESFYQRMGATRLVSVEKDIEGEGFTGVDLWQCPTKLSAGQFHRLKKILLPR